MIKVQKSKDCIPTTKLIIIILLLCAIASGIMLALGFGSNIPGRPPTVAIFFGSLLGLALDVKTVFLSEEKVKVRYLLFWRNIAWNRVKGIEFAHHRDNTFYMFICLDDCPFWSETNNQLRNYSILHFTRVIYVRIDGTQINKYKEIAKKYCKNVIDTYSIWTDNCAS